MRHCTRCRRSRARSDARREGRPRAGDLLGLDEALSRRAALSRILRVRSRPEGPDRARDAAARYAAHFLADALRTPLSRRYALRGGDSDFTPANGTHAVDEGEASSLADPAGVVSL